MPRSCARPERGLLPTVAWRIGGETVHAVDGGVYDAGAAVEWAGRLGLFAEFTELDGFTEPPAIERGLAFVPALSGLACPHWDRSAAALWVGMTAGTTRRDLCQALLEGVALRTAEVVAAMADRVPLADRLTSTAGSPAAPTSASSWPTPPAASSTATASTSSPPSAARRWRRARLGLTLRMPEAGSAEFRPQAEGRAWRARFTEAVSRSRGWR